MRIGHIGTLLIFAAACLAAARANAQDPRFSGYSGYHSHYHGSESSGPMSREEAESRFRRYDFFLSELDTNHNGVLEAEEVSGSKRYYADRLLQRAGVEPNYPVALSRVREGLQQYYTAQMSGTTTPGVLPGTSLTTGISTSPLGVTSSILPTPGVTPGVTPRTTPGMLPGTTSALSTAALPATQSLVLGFGVPANAPPVLGFGDAARSSPLTGLSTTKSASSTSSSSSSGSKGPPPPGPPSRGPDSKSGDPRSREDDAKLAQYAKGLLQQYDKNKNGVLEKDEWSQMKGDVKEADRDHNGIITLEELTVWLARYSRGRSHGPGPTDSAPAGADGQKSLAYRFRTATERLPAGLPDWYLQKDTDHDGQLSMAEFVGGLDEAKAQQFSEYDLNGDGFVTPAECLAVEKQKKEKATSVARDRDRRRPGGDSR